MKTNGTCVGRKGPRTLRMRLAVLLSLLGMGGSAMAQSPEFTSQLYDARVDVARLTPETLQSRTGEATFLVDDPSIVNVELYSNLAGLTTSIEGPGGLVVDPLSVTTIGGTYRDFAVSGTQSELCLFLQPMCEPGLHYLYSFPSQGAGDYVVKFTAPVGMGGVDEGAVITRFDTSSTAAASIIPTQTRLKNGETVVLTAIVGDGASAITGATVNVQLKTPTSDEFDITFNLFDDGDTAGHGDHLAGDGLYSGTYITTEAGEYGVLAEINGTTLLGNPFVRQVGTSFEAYDPPAVFIQPLVLSDAGVDEPPANGLFEILEISADVMVTDSGEYTLTAILTTGAGGVVVGSDQSFLTSGSPRTIKAGIAAESLIERDQFGQYTITELNLTYFGVSGDDLPILADRIVNVGVLTSSYQKEDFERARITVLEELISSAATDNSEPFGLNEELVFTVPLDILFDGTYFYSCGLFAPCGLDVNGIESFALIEIVTGEFVVSTAPATVNWVLTFDGGLIAASGLAGPYSVQNASIYGRAPMLVLELAEDDSNPVLQASDFEGWTGLPDCNANATADSCDLARDPGADCDRNDIPDDCPGEDPVPTGSCCDGAGGVCTDGVQVCDCPFRFEADVLCADLIPPCVVACCKPDETCEDLTEPACLAEGGAPLAGKLCSEDNVVCYASCFTATNCCFQQQPELEGVIGCSDPVICSTVCATDPEGGSFDDCCGVGALSHWGAHCRDEAVRVFEERFGELSNCNINTDPAFPSDPFYDMCEIADGAAFDCNGNGAPDDCDISDGTSTDCDENQVPDECESGACCALETGDCIEDVSACDCNDDFEVDATCASLQTPCAWACCHADDSCTDETFEQCQIAGGVLAPGAQCLDQGFACPSCDGGTGCCFEANGVAACGDENCCGTVCLIDPYCCGTTWDSLCVSEAFDLCDPNLMDECLESPILAPEPHDILKNRYISIDPRGAGGVNVGKDFDIKVTLTSTLVNGVTAVGSSWWANAPDDDCISVVGPSRPAMALIWDDCSTLHLTGCPIIPTSTYDIVAVFDLVESAPLIARTQAKPGVNWWGDCVGVFDGSVWAPPDGTASVDDMMAVIRTWKQHAAATHVSVTDLAPAQDGAQINKIVNFEDVFAAIRGFQGREYPGQAIDQCLDP